jgi:hypothetical protein
MRETLKCIGVFVMDFPLPDDWEKSYDREDFIEFVER